MFTDYGTERVSAKQRFQCLKQCLHKTLRKFPMLTKFVHCHNAFEDLRFREHVRRLHFARRINNVLGESSSNSNSEDMEMVQLLCS